MKTKEEWIQENFLFVAVTILGIGAILLVVETVFSVKMKGIGWYVILVGACYCAADYYGLLKGKRKT